MPAEMEHMLRHEVALLPLSSVLMLVAVPLAR